jgi:hypothetical protein
MLIWMSSVLEDLGELVAGELTALISVENLRMPIATQGLLKGFHTEVRSQCIGQSPGQNSTTMPIHDRYQVHESTRHRDIRNVSGPHLIGLVDLSIRQQIWVDPMPRAWLGRPRPAIQRFNPHPFHQCANMAAPDLEPLSLEQVSEHPATRKRMRQMESINPVH